MSRIRGVIWDLDGTLLDTLGDLTGSVNAALQAHEMPCRTADEVKSFVGNGVAKLVERSVPAGTPPAQTEQVLATFREQYAAHWLDTTAPYPGIEEGLQMLAARGVPMAVVSNKLEPAVEALRRHFFADTVSVAVGDLPGRPVKPAPDSTLAALAALGLSPEETLFVGDSDVDIRTAENVGMPCLSVSWGFRDGAFLRQSGATAVATTVEEAFAYILAAVTRENTR